MSTIQEMIQLYQIARKIKQDATREMQSAIKQSENRAQDILNYMKATDCVPGEAYRVDVGEEQFMVAIDDTYGDIEVSPNLLLRVETIEDLPKMPQPKSA